MIQIDADLSHDPAALPDLLAAVERGADLAIGSRYVPGGVGAQLAEAPPACSRCGAIATPAFVLGYRRARLDRGLPRVPRVDPARDEHRVDPLDRLRVPDRDDVPRAARRRAHRRGSDLVHRPRARHVEDVEPHRRRGDDPRDAVGDPRPGAAARTARRPTAEHGPDGRFRASCRGRTTARSRPDGAAGSRGSQALLDRPRRDHRGRARVARRLRDPRARPHRCSTATPPTTTGRRTSSRRASASSTRRATSCSACITPSAGHPPAYILYLAARLAVHRHERAHAPARVDAARRGRGVHPRRARAPAVRRTTGPAGSRRCSRPGTRTSGSTTRCSCRRACTCSRPRSRCGPRTGSGTSPRRAHRGAHGRSASRSPR